MHSRAHVQFKCLLVQGYPFNCVSWGLPKGKLEQNEKDVDCAVREVSYWEIGMVGGEHLRDQTKPWLLKLFFELP